MDASNALFWIHMMQAVGSTDWGDFTPGGFPTNVTNIRAVNATELQMTMNKAYNPQWFTYNQLSQITPMPEAWDRTASGPSHCTTTVSDCAAVYSYLDSQSKNLSGWASSPIWSVVDGPWKLSSFNSDGHSTFVPNTAFSGSPKPHLAKFEEVPFTTEGAEYNVLQAGAAGGSQKIDVGYIPTTDAPPKDPNATVGSNPLNGYTLDPWYPWGINYFPVNFQSTTGNGPIIRQLYFREALEYLMNQEAVIKGPLHGYGLFTVGPVGTYPPNPYLSSQGKAGDPFPYNPTMAKQLLTSHGWNVAANGSTTCTDPAKCGTGVKAGQGLSFTLPYVTGITWVQQEMTQLQSNASQLGIKLNLEPKPFNQVTAIAAPNCVVRDQPRSEDGGRGEVPAHDAADGARLGAARPLHARGRAVRRPQLDVYQRTAAACADAGGRVGAQAGSLVRHAACRGGACRGGRRQLRVVHGQHQLVLPAAAERPGAWPERRRRQHRGRRGAASRAGRAGGGGQGPSAGTSWHLYTACRDRGAVRGAVHGQHRARAQRAARHAFGVP